MKKLFLCGFVSISGLLSGFYGGLAPEQARYKFDKVEQLELKVGQEVQLPIFSTPNASHHWGFPAEKTPEAVQFGIIQWDNAGVILKAKGIKPGKETLKAFKYCELKAIAPCFGHRIDITVK